MKTKARKSRRARKPMEKSSRVWKWTVRKTARCWWKARPAACVSRDEFTARRGSRSRGLFPAILGQKAGNRGDAGPAVVTSCAKKARSCHPPLHARDAACKSCTSAQDNLCTASRATQGKG